jgi:N-acetylneuraminate synthase
MKKIKLPNRLIGEGEPLYFIADIGANHDGDLERAYKLIELAKEAGADAAKFQNFTANKIVSQFGFENLSNQSPHQKSWKKSVVEVYEDASISKEWTSLLKDKCKEVGIDYFTSPYDTLSVDLVDPFVDLYKIGSGDITWHEILNYIAKKGKPMLIATGATDMHETKLAVNTVQKHTDDIVLMQCNTNYSGDKNNHKYANLNVLKTFRKEFPNMILGLSDHTHGHATVAGAVALGALVIEKHFTDDNDRVGPDHKFAMNPSSWREMVDCANQVYEALGDGVKVVEENEKDSQVVQRRSLRSIEDFPEGHIISENDLEALRPIPSDGIPPYKINELIGKSLTKNLKKGEHITLNHIL